MSDPISSVMASKECDRHRAVLGLIFHSNSNPRTAHYIDSVREYLRTSQTCIVPRRFANDLLLMMEKLDESLRPKDPRIDGDLLRISANLSRLAEKITCNTELTIPYQGDKGQTYLELFVGKKLRWESVGIYCALVACSLVHAQQSVGNFDIPRMIEASSMCVDICRRIGPINEMGVLSIYQNLMATSQHYGDKDKRTRSQLSELANAIVESGLNKDEKGVDVPPRLIGLRRCLLVASLTIDETICAADSCRELIKQCHVDNLEGNGDPWVWPISSGYGPQTWVQLRFALVNLRVILKIILGTAGNTTATVAVSVVECYSLWWNKLPRYLRYPELFAGKDTAENARQIRLLVASAYLEFLCIKLEAHPPKGAIP
ncbi:hypothetical protein F5B19DRAFT_78347 [Rostrohypoxylon terebratum]|nr:hypothetical protein F5B19DRAFT_78347 [Rostrohypoxylon terebratum]